MADDADRRAVEAAFSDRVCELFRALCLSFEAHDPSEGVRTFGRALDAAKKARDQAIAML